MLYVSEMWKKSYPTACVGLLMMEKVTNPEQSELLTLHKRELESNLKSEFKSRDELLAHPAIKAYSTYYKRFSKTYHVQQQLESVLFKGKQIPNIAGLVEAMFMAELKNGLLTAGHDHASLQLPLTLDLASGHETYTLINGKEQLTKPDDMMITDAAGVISSIVHGPDARTRLRPTTQTVLFTVYAPPGITQDAVRSHLSDIQDFVRLFSPDAVTTELNIYPMTNPI